MVTRRKAPPEIHRPDTEGGERCAVIPPRILDPPQRVLAERRQRVQPPLRIAAQENGAVLIGDQHIVIAGLPGCLQLAGADLDHHAAGHLFVVVHRIGEIVAALARCGAEGKEAPKLAFHRILKVGAVAEVLAHEGIRLAPVARGDRLPAAVHKIGIRRAGNPVYQFELLIDGELVLFRYGFGQAADDGRVAGEELRLVTVRAEFAPQGFRDEIERMAAAFVQVMQRALACPMRRLPRKQHEDRCRKRQHCRHPPQGGSDLLSENQLVPSPSRLILADGGASRLAPYTVEILAWAIQL